MRMACLSSETRSSWTQTGIQTSTTTTIITQEGKLKKEASQAVVKSFGPFGGVCRSHKLKQNGPNVPTTLLPP